MDGGIWVVRTLNQLFIRGSYTQIKFSKKGVSEKTPFFVIVSFCSPYSICLNTGFWQGRFVWKCCGFGRSIFN